MLFDGKKGTKGLLYGLMLKLSFQTFSCNSFLIIPLDLRSLLYKVNCVVSMFYV